VFLLPKNAELVNKTRELSHICTGNDGVCKCALAAGHVEGNGEITTVRFIV